MRNYFSGAVAVAIFSLLGSQDAQAFGKKPFRLPPPPSVSIANVSNNIVTVVYQNLPKVKAGKHGEAYEILLVGNYAREHSYHHTSAPRFSGGTGWVNVPIPHDAIPDHYRVVVLNNKNGDRPAKSENTFAYIPVLEKVNARVVFDTNMGYGQHDKMTYAEYNSTMKLTALEDVSIGQIVPSLWYCNGDCYFSASFQDLNGKQILAIAGNTFPVGGTLAMAMDLAYKIKLKKGAKIKVVTRVWTTKSIGIHTSGRQLAAKRSGNFLYELLSSTYPDRGGIGFQLRDTL